MDTRAGIISISKSDSDELLVEKLNRNFSYVATLRKGGTVVVSPGGGGTTDYEDLNNKPSVNNVTLSGNKTLSQLGAADVATSGSYNDLTDTPTIPTVPSASTASPLMDGTASAGVSVAWSRGDHVHPSDTAKVDKVAGKGLSSNDYTDTEQDKVAVTAYALGETQAVLGYDDYVADHCSYVSQASSPYVAGTTYYTRGGLVNLLDRTTDTTGYFINAQGVISSDAPSEYSALIPVTPGETYTVSGVCSSSSGGNKRFHGYNSSGVWVRQLAYVTGVNNQPWSSTFTIPAGVTQVRLSFRTADGDVTFVNGSDPQYTYEIVAEPDPADIADYYVLDILTSMKDALDGKQATLVSGTNIKTVNNESLLGSGNITISGGTATNGLPSGGTAEQVLSKRSSADYDAEWLNVGTAWHRGWSANISDEGACYCDENGDAIIGGALPVEYGGTGASTAATARTNLNAVANAVTTSNPGVTFTAKSGFTITPMTYAVFGKLVVIQFSVKKTSAWTAWSTTNPCSVTGMKGGVVCNNTGYGALNTVSGNIWLTPSSAYAANQAVEFVLIGLLA